MSKNDEAAAKDLGQQPGAPTRLPDSAINAYLKQWDGNPPLSAPTNTDELLKILNAHTFTDETAFSPGLLEDLLVSLARLIALKQREGLQQLSRNSERHEADGICNSEFYISTDDLHKIIAELNTIIEGEK